MDDKQVGWGFVGLQAVLLLAVIFGPSGNDWGQPGWLRVITLIIQVLGFAVVVAGASGLGSSLTPTPVPVDAGSLKTGGLYGLMRHPIYTGVMLIVVGSVLGSGSIARAVIGVITIAFFNVKARWEEGKLVERYPECPAYASVVPRFIPNPTKL